MTDYHSKREKVQSQISNVQLKHRTQTKFKQKTSLTLNSNLTSNILSLGLTHNRIPTSTLTPMRLGSFVLTLLLTPKCCDDYFKKSNSWSFWMRLFCKTISSTPHAFCFRQTRKKCKFRFGKKGQLQVYASIEWKFQVNQQIKRKHHTSMIQTVKLLCTSICCFFFNQINCRLFKISTNRNIQINV